MTMMPDNPTEFSQEVAQILRRLQPELTIDSIREDELVIAGRRLDLVNLYRIVSHDPQRGVEIVEHYLEQLFAGDLMYVNSMTLDIAKTRIMPRIQPESIFESLSRRLVAHTPFVNGAVVVYVLDLPQMTVSITTEQIVQWGLDIDELEMIARDNLEEYAPDMDVQLVESREGGMAAILAEQDGYDAARLLMGKLYHRLAPQLGGDFLVAIPARDMFVALSREPAEFVHRIQDRVRQDYERLPYPITDQLFYVTRDGVAGTGETKAA
ncbi:MAG: DUF1444 family protein [Planctomycetota bacterium]|nr:DUF1444 family protein [Phycisphaerales bacterium]